MRDFYFFPTESSLGITTIMTWAALAGRVAAIQARSAAHATIIVDDDG
jgi:hypothetical protein